MSITKTKTKTKKINQNENHTLHIDYLQQMTSISDE